jgi:hypothetical protein
MLRKGDIVRERGGWQIFIVMRVKIRKFSQHETRQKAKIISPLTGDCLCTWSDFLVKQS